MRLSITEVAIVLGWSVTSVRLYLKDERMRGVKESTRGGGGLGWRWTVRAGDLRKDFASALQARRDSTAHSDHWI